jgi:hypothetical protein
VFAAYDTEDEPTEQPRVRKGNMDDLRRMAASAGLRVIEGGKG